MLISVGVCAAVAVLLPVFHWQGLPWIDATSVTLSFVLSAVLMMWAAWQLLSRRGIWEPWPRMLATHALIGLGFAVLWTLIFAGARYLIFMPSAEANPSEGLIWQVVWGLFIYVGLAQVARTRARLHERETAARHAELLALRSQLNPHFLFNTLHSLTQLAREDPAATQLALERFGQLMRYVLDSGADVATDATMEDELEFIEHYLALERLRLGDRLRVVNEVDPDALELALPPLVLQPLVENAVRHGIAPRREGGTLVLTARMRGEAGIVEVADDGRGCDPRVWQDSGGLGLASVARQLRSRYGGEATLDVETAPGRGFKARIAVPARLPVTRGRAS